MASLWRGFANAFKYGFVSQSMNKIYNVNVVIDKCNLHVLVRYHICGWLHFVN